MKSEKMEKKMTSLTLHEINGRKPVYQMTINGKNSILNLSTKFWELLSSDSKVTDSRRTSYGLPCKELSHTHMTFGYDQDTNKLRIHFTDNKEDNSICVSPSKKWTKSIQPKWRTALTASVKRLFNAMPSLPELAHNQKMVFKDKFNMEYCLRSKQVILDLNKIDIQEIQTRS